MDSNLIAAIALAATIISNLMWAINQHTNAEKKKYAAERDFQHLKRNQEAISQGINDAFQDIESSLTLISRDIQEIKIHMGKDK